MNIKTFATLIILLLLSSLSLYAEEYTIAKEDVLLIKVYDEPDLETKTRVDSEGNISFPLLRSVEAVGLTVRDLEKKLETLLEKDYLVDPNVNIFIEEYRKKQVSVTGAVKDPGVYDLPRDKKTTFIEVISMAGGFKNSAAINKSKVIRQNSDQENITIPIKVSDITKKGKKEEDIEILAGDVIVVPNSFF